MSWRIPGPWPPSSLQHACINVRSICSVSQCCADTSTCTVLPASGTCVFPARHHLSDVAAGLFLGLAVAWVFYRHIFVSALSRHPGKLSAEVAEAEEEEAWAGEASGVRLSGSAEHLLAAAGHPASPDVQPAEESV